MNVGRWNRRTTAQFVLLAWAGALGWLARRELGKTEADSIAEATIRLNPEAHFYAIKAGRHQIGYASVTVDTIPTGFRLSEVLALDVPDADSVRRVTRRTELELSRSLRLRGFERTVTGGGLYEQFSGTVVRDSVLNLSKRDGRDQEPIRWSLALSGDIVLPEVLPYRLAFGRRLEVGRRVEAKVFDLATGTIGQVAFVATAESTFVVADSAIEQGRTHRWKAITFDTVKAYRIEHEAGGTPTVQWVDEHGGLVQTEAALGVRLERSAFELVSFNYRQNVEQQGAVGHRQVPGMATVLGAGIRPSHDSVASFRILTEPVERFLVPRTSWLAGGRQVTTGDDRLTVGGGDAQLGTNRPKSEYLDPAAAIPPGDPALAELASTISGTRVGRDRMKALAVWVAATIHDDRRASAAIFPSRVLRTKEAGAGGHAELFVALCRALGIQARVVSGVLVQGGKVYGHAWAEVDEGGGWQAVDPTFGDVPASSHLIRITVGGAGRPIDLVPLLGAANFEPIDAGSQ